MNLRLKCENYANSVLIYQSPVTSSDRLQWNINKKYSIYGFSREVKLFLILKA